MPTISLTIEIETPELTLTPEQIETAVKVAVMRSRIPNQIEIERIEVKGEAVTCILKKNHMSGLIGSHKTTCPHVRSGATCGEAATCHIAVGSYWCGNVDKPCANEIAKNHPHAEVTEEVFILAEN